MKTKIVVDATPEEWRRFFGMPDVSEFHSELLNQIREKIASGEYDAFDMMKQFVPENFQKIADIQQDFWQSLFQQKPDVDK